MSLSGPSLKVLKTFISRANEQYRAAGLDEYQMRVRRDGSVEIPANARRSRFNAGAAADAKVAASAGEQGAAGAAQVQRSGAAPTIAGAKQAGADGFELTWQPVDGATQYGIWQDGALLGHVPSPSFAGTLDADGTSMLQIDAVLGDGTRTQLTQAVAMKRSGSDPVAFSAAS